jgi:hypothetical protein
MEINRREFIVLPGTPVAAMLPGVMADAPWHQRIRRVGQVNFTERDPVEIDVEAWANYWAGLKVDAVLVSVTGILAFYPTEVPFHRRSAFLGNRDLFGECAAAAKKRGIRVVARMSPDLQWEEALKPHPEWFERNADGSFNRHTEDPRLYRTCMFSTYFTEHMPAIMREISARYDVDAFYTNGWPPLGRMPACYCDNCRGLGAPGSIEYWEKFSDRVVYLWKLYDSIAKEKKPGNVFYANLGGGVRMAPDISKLRDVCQWFNCDNQGRGGDATPIWGCAQQGRVCYASTKGRTSTNVTAGWSTGSIRWRNASKSAPEAEIWMDQTVASGMVPWYHFIGAQKGLGEDRRWQEIGRRYFTWLARHERHFFNKRPIANLGVVIGQRTQLFYKSPGGGNATEFMDGMYYALVEGRFLFDFVHEDDLGAENLKKYTALVLPNTALLSDAQCAQLQAYADAGGSLIATFETGMYDERNRRREESGLARVFGIARAGEVATSNGNGFYARIERQHPILEGFVDTNWIPGAQFRLPVKPVPEPVLTVVPSYVAYPPELSYPPVERTTEPALVLTEKGRSRRIYFSGDVERSLWRSGHTDLTRLLQNAVRWALHNESPASIEGEGVIEAFAWETEAGFALHLLNYTNPNMHRGWLRRHYAVGEQKVRMKLPPGSKIKRVELLRAETDIPFRQTGDMIEFTVPKILDYEVAAMS